MKNEKKELIKNFKVVIEDLLDNYEKYTDEEKKQVETSLKELQSLNVILEKYDKKAKSKNIWEIIAECWNNATGKK